MTALHALLLVLLVSACVTDEYGFRGTPFMLRQVKKAREDGSLACGFVFARSTRFHPFDIQCRYDAEAVLCTCIVQTESRSAQPIFPVFPVEYPFTPDVCREWLPEGLDWPPSKAFIAMMADIEAMKRTSQAGAAP